ncbi:MAG: 5-formyltetrahydrofolate cyclo-ligase [Parasphingorhabdus sp.]|uniref:5-formyltetrahydrofolate cyclo-ligase n=1 Tax=Parasphingorhabdus sp. TaxID=2709688 RepID=UPI003297787A
MNNLVEDKKKLREEYKRRRKAFYDQLDPATKGLAFRRPPTPLAQLINDSETIALYSAMGSEAPTARLAEYCIEIGKNLCFPVVIGRKPLEFRLVDSINILQAGYQNIAEPGTDCPVVVPDLIIAPLVAFDRSLSRLGQGQGHYDRSFENLPHARRIGLAWSVQETENVPNENHDVTLEMIVTESEIIQSVNMTS